MEDFMIINDDLQISKIHLCSLFCVVDGHGGWECAKFIVDNIADTMKNTFALSAFTNLDEAENID